MSKKDLIPHGPNRGPVGKPAKKVTKGLSKLRHLTKAELVEIMNIVVCGRAADLAALVNDKDATFLEQMVYSIVTKIKVNGDMASFDKLMDRMVGKVTDKMHLSADMSIARVVVNLPSNGREAKK